MKGYLFLLFKEIKFMLKNKSFYIWVLFMPLLFLLIFSKIGQGSSKISVLIVDKVNNAITKEFVERIKKDFRVLNLESGRKNLPLIELSGDFLLKSKEKTKVKVLFPEDYPQDRKIYLKISIYKTLAELTAKHRLGINRVKQFVSLKERHEKLLEIPWGIRHTLPAIILMFILFNVLTKGVEKFFMYKDEGLIERFSLTPQGAKGVLVFFILYQVTLALISVTVIFVLGSLFFKLSLKLNSVIYLYLIFFVFSILVSSFSLMVFSLVRRKEAAIALGVLIANVLCALGGLWWPIEIVPPFFKKLGLILPTGFTMSLIDKVLYFNLPIVFVLKDFFVLLFLSVLFFIAGVFVFVKKQFKYS